MLCAGKGAGAGLRPRTSISASHTPAPYNKIARTAVSARKAGQGHPLSDLLQIPRLPRACGLARSPLVPGSSEPARHQCQHRRQALPRRHDQRVQPRRPHFTAN
jgi:hypothetical protein